MTERNVSSLVSRRAAALPSPPPLPTPPAAAERPVEQPSAAEHPAAPATTTTRPRPAPRTTPKRPRAAGGRGRAAADRADDQTRPVTVYLPAELAGRVRDAALDERLSLGEWLLDAYDRLFDRLDDVYAPQEEARRPSGLPARRRPRRRTVASGTQLQFALTGQELAVLDEHRDRVGVDSRSEWFTTIAEMALSRTS
jgi:hypothetical protein